MLRDDAVLTLLDFSPEPYYKALPGETILRNAWVLNGRMYVLEFYRGDAGFSLSLHGLVPGVGLLPLGVSFGFGC